MENCILINPVTNERTIFTADSELVTVELFEGDECTETLFLSEDIAESLKKHLLKETASMELKE